MKWIVSLNDRKLLWICLLKACRPVCTENTQSTWGYGIAYIFWTINGPKLKNLFQNRDVYYNCCRWSVSPASKFVCTSLLRMVMQGFDTRVYTGELKFAVGVTNGRERERASQAFVSLCVCVCVVDRIPFAWGTPVPL